MSKRSEQGKPAKARKQHQTAHDAEAAAQATKDRNAGRSLRNRIRGVERLLKRGLEAPARAVQEAKLAELKAQLESQQVQQRQSALERKMTLRYRRVCH